MTKQMEAILMIAAHPSVARVFEPIIDEERETIHWDRFTYGGLSGGQKAAIAWAYCIWTDQQIPDDKHGDEIVNIMDADWRDPFDSFGVMDRDLQVLVLKALAHRHGTFEPMSPIETYLRSLSKR